LIEDENLCDKKNIFKWNELITKDKREDIIFRLLNKLRVYTIENSKLKGKTLASDEKKKQVKILKRNKNCWETICLMTSEPYVWRRLLRP